MFLIYENVLGCRPLPQNLPCFFRKKTERLSNFSFGILIFSFVITTPPPLVSILIIPCKYLVIVCLSPCLVHCYPTHSIKRTHTHCNTHTHARTQTKLNFKYLLHFILLCYVTIFLPTKIRRNSFFDFFSIRPEIK